MRTAFGKVDDAGPCGHPRGACSIAPTGVAVSAAATSPANKSVRRRVTTTLTRPVGGNSVIVIRDWNAQMAMDIARPVRVVPGKRSSDRRLEAILRRPPKLPNRF